MTSVSVVVPSVDNLEPYLDSLLKELEKTDTPTSEDITDLSVGTKIDNFTTLAIEDESSTQVEKETQDEEAKKQLSFGQNEGSVYYTQPFYLKSHLNMMCNFGLCKIKRMGAFQESFCHLGLLILMASLALVQALAILKDFVLGDAKRGSVFHYITAWYYFHTFVVSCYFLKLISRGSRLHALVKNLENLFEERTINSNQEILHNQTSKLVILITTVSVISAGALALGLDIFLITHNPKQVVEIRATDFTKTLFLWKRSNYSENAITLYEAYGNFSGVSVALGAIEFFVQFAGWLQYFMIKDIMLMASLTLYSHAEVYKAYIKSIEMLDLPILTQIWKNYELLYKISTEIESCFGKLFQLIHIDNWLFCAFFLYSYVDLSEIEPIYFLVNLVVVIKVAVMYYLSAKANSVNAITRSKLHIDFYIGRGEKNDLKNDVVYMDLKIKMSPVGIGSGNFLVHEDFPYKFLGSVASSFLFFLKSEDE